MEPLVDTAAVAAMLMTSTAMVLVGLQAPPRPAQVGLPRLPARHPRLPLPPPRLSRGRIVEASGLERSTLLGGLDDQASAG